MANPAKLTVTNPTANGSVVRPAADSIDTNGMVPILNADLLGASDRLILEVVEGNARALTVTVAHGDNPPAVREGAGNLVVAIPQNTGAIIGPLEPARFLQASGNIEVTFTGTGGAATATVRAYRLPKSA